MEYEKVIPWITSLTSWDLWPFICPTFTKLCDCLLPACTLDHHFVFSVPAALMDPPLSPAMLFTLGNATCKPERVTSDYALFKIPMDGCGAHKIVSCGGGKRFWKSDPKLFSIAGLGYSLHNLMIHKPSETKLNIQKSLDYFMLILTSGMAGGGENLNLHGGGL